MAGSYVLEDYEKLADNIHFFRIRVNKDNVSITLKEVLEHLSDLSWINRFDEVYMQTSFNLRAEHTINYITDKIITGDEVKLRLILESILFLFYQKKQLLII